MYLIIFHFSTTFKDKFHKFIYLHLSEYDLCGLLDQAFKRTGTTNCPWQLTNSNIGCTCPILAGTYTLQHSQFRIPTATGMWSWLVVVSVLLKNKT